LANNSYPADFIFNNLAIQTNIIHAAYKNNVKKLLFLGSSCIYPKDCSQPMKEEYLLSGYLESTNEPYAIAKIAGIKMCQSYNRQYGTNYISVMPTNLYGPHDNFDLETSHVLPALIRKFHLGKLATEGKWKEIKKDEQNFGKIPKDIRKALGLDSMSSSLGFRASVHNANLQPQAKRSYNACEAIPAVILWGSGSPRRELLHVIDLADACLFLMQNYDESEIINIGTGKDMTIKELAETVARVTGYDGTLRFDTSKPDGTPVKLLDVSRLNALGWYAKIEIEKGIKETYDWYIS
jgi:GDP-L-fucose synthase